MWQADSDHIHQFVVIHWLLKKRRCSRLERALFIAVNRLLSPPHLRQAFEDYIARSLAEEMGRIADYYGERHGGFWVALEGNRIVGTFGLERTTGDAMELRRMYVDPSLRRLELSTSELQSEALASYRDAGYKLLREEIADESTNKTVGRGIRRYHFEKAL